MEPALESILNEIINNQIKIISLLQKQLTIFSQYDSAYHEELERGREVEIPK